MILQAVNAGSSSSAMISVPRHEALLPCSLLAKTLVLPCTWSTPLSGFAAISTLAPRRQIQLPCPLLAELLCSFSLTTTFLPSWLSLLLNTPTFLTHGRSLYRDPKPPLSAQRSKTRPFRRLRYPPFVAPTSSPATPHSAAPLLAATFIPDSPIRRHHSATIGKPFDRHKILENISLKTKIPLCKLGWREKRGKK